MGKHLHAIKIVLLSFCCINFIFSSQNALASPGSITVYSPYSGDIYYEGNSITISWTSYDAGDWAKIELFRSGSYYSTITLNTSIYDGSYSWTIPTGYSSTTYFQIKVSSLTDTNAYDFSGTFYIYKKSITVTSPAGEETWFRGSTYSITWTSENAGSDVEIELYKSGSLYSIITPSTENSENYYWLIPSDQPVGSYYQIKVTDYYDSNIFGLSEYFTIDERTIIITSPASGETWYRGEKNTIKWTQKNAGDYVRMEYGCGSSYNVITSYASNSGSYEWNIPSYAVLGDQYKIRITSFTYGDVFDESNEFSIDERYITIVSPTSGDRWYPNETYTISWNYKNAGGHVDIRLFKNNVYCATIISNIDNSKSYAWAISDIFAPDSDYEIEVRSKEIGVVYGRSYDFSIGERTITITSPTSDELWYKGESHTITWNSENAGSTIDIELYKDDNRYSTIASHVNNEGSYNWHIPTDLPTGSSYQIKITSSQYPDVYGFSAGNIKLEETVLQKLTIPLVAIIIIIVVAIVSYIVLKKLRRRKSEENVINQLELMQQQELIHQTKFTQDEYEKIWEKNKP